MTSIVGTGMVTIALASLIIGETLLGKRTMVLRVLGVVFGSCLYRFIVAVALRFDVPAAAMKLVSAIIVAVAISMPAIRQKIAFEKRKQEAGCVTPRSTAKRRQSDADAGNEGGPQDLQPGHRQREGGPGRGDLALQEGDFATIVGSNGAGKSTLFNAITGGFIADEGCIVLGGRGYHLHPEYRRSRVIGHLFQDPLKGTAPNMTIEENLALALSAGGHSPAGLLLPYFPQGQGLFP